MTVQDIVQMLVGPAVVVAAVTLVTSAISGWRRAVREDRGRRRDRLAEAYSAYSAYREFPFTIRRRRHDEAEAERVRITGEVSKVQERIHYYLAWTALEDPKVGRAYAELVKAARRTAGREMQRAWRMPAPAEDSEMNIADIDLSGADAAEDAYLRAVRRHLNPVRGRLRPWRRVPGAAAPARLDSSRQS